MQAGGISESEMFRTFNMGIGMVLVVDQSDVEQVLDANIGAFVIGSIVEGEGVQLI